MTTPDLIYDWNQNYPAGMKPPGPVLINDETLRDGLQSPSVRDPSIAEKIEILHLMEALGIDSLALGLPGAGPRAVEAVTALAREIATQKMKIRANCAARTHENDIRPIAEIVQKTGLRIEAATFIGSSPIRRFTEGWTDDFLSADHREGRKICGFAGARRDVCHRGHEPLRSGDCKETLCNSDQMRRPRDLHLRYRRTRHAHGRARAGAICDRRSA